MVLQTRVRVKMARKFMDSCEIGFNYELFYRKKSTQKKKNIIDK